MGLRWSTPRVLGFSYGVHIRGPRRDSPASTALGYGMLFGLTILALTYLIHVWYVAVPIAVILGGLVLLGKLAQRRETMPRSAPDKSRPQASVSNRR